MAYFTEVEERALAAGWRPDPDDFDQWKHPNRDEVYWNAMDIPGQLLTALSHESK